MFKQKLNQIFENNPRFQEVHEHPNNYWVHLCPLYWLRVCREDAK